MQDETGNKKVFNNDVAKPRSFGDNEHLKNAGVKTWTNVLESKI